MRAIAVERVVVVWRHVHQRHQASGRRALCCVPSDNDGKLKTHRHPSTPATPSDAAASKLVEETVWQKHAQGKTIFPWRHETEPLERLVDPTVHGGVMGPGMRAVPWWLKHIFTQASAVHLNVPWYQVFTTSKWRQELANASGFAFSQAVAGVLCNTYKVPFQDTVSDDGVVDFSTVTQVSEHDTKEDDAPGDKQQEAANDDETPKVEYMMEEKLRKLYEASHEFGKDQMRIVLQTEPVHCELVSLLFIPYITRQAVHDHPTLKHSFRNMFRAVEEKRIDSETGQPIGFVQLVQEAFKVFGEYVNSRAQFNSDDGSVVMESTVIAQVLIECDEVFSVTDVATGMIMQGNGEKQRVYHLVRLEVVVKELVPSSGAKPIFQLESWQIVDWDDLEGGNIWYV